MHERGTPCVCHGVSTLRDVAYYPYYTINAYILLVWGVWGPIKESKYRILHKDPWMPYISAAFTVISQESVAQSQRAGYIHTARGGDCKQTHRQYRETEYKSCMLYRPACLELTNNDDHQWNELSNSYEGRLSQQAAAAQAGISIRARIHGVNMIVNIVEMLHM